MEYQLAKRLKEAGFPQKKAPFCVKAPELDLDEKGNQIRCYLPTLKELIESCGERFFDLRSCKKSGWEASADEQKWGTCGKTPLEAVANLWLKLHETSK